MGHMALRHRVESARTHDTHSFLYFRVARSVFAGFSPGAGITTPRGSATLPEGVRTSLHSAPNPSPGARAGRDSRETIDPVPGVRAALTHCRMLQRFSDGLRTGVRILPGGQTFLSARDVRIDRLSGRQECLPPGSGCVASCATRTKTALGGLKPSLQATASAFRAPCTAVRTGLEPSRVLMQPAVAPRSSNARTVVGGR